MIGQKGIPATGGGVERHVEELSLRLGRLGFDVTVYGRKWYSPANAKFARNVRVVLTPSIHTKHLDAITHTLTATIAAIRSRADIIHYHGVGPALLAWIPRIFAPQTKVIVTFHCIDRERTDKWGGFAQAMLWLGEKAACLFPHETITVSNILQGYCMRSHGRKPVCIPNGVTLPSARIGTDAIEKFGLKKNGYILVVARLMPSKGIHYLIDAFDALRRTGKARGKKLVIVGGSAFTDAYVDHLQRMAAGNPDILFTGFLKGKPLRQMFANAAVFVHPSETEGLPITVIEAMSYGVPTIVSDIPEHLELVRGFGATFANRNVRDLAVTLDTVLARTRLYRAKAKEGVAHIERNYLWDDVAEDTAVVYRAALTAGYTVPAFAR